jgi:hypothetical protein
MIYLSNTQHQLYSLGVTFLKSSRLGKLLLRHFLLLLKAMSQIRMLELDLSRSSQFESLSGASVCLHFGHRMPPDLAAMYNGYENNAPIELQSSLAGSVIK